MLKTIIFDLGNVIINVDKTEQFEKFSVDSSKSVAYIKKYYENSHLRKEFERGKITPRQFYYD